MRNHLLEVWDPIEGSEHLQAHSLVLLDAVRRFRSGRCTEDDVYVWWGHDCGGGAAPDRDQLEAVLRVPVEPSRDDPGPETLLYLTDFSSLYVAHVGEITREDVTSRRSASVPRIYRRNKMRCEVWYRLWDMRRIVDQDTQGVARQLRELKIANSERPLALRGGIPKAPFVVTSDREDRYFEPAIRKQFIEDKFWVEFDSTRIDVGAVERDLRNNHFGNEAWNTYSPLARTFIATAERLWRDHSTDPMFDISVVLLELAKAVEVRVNEILKRAMQKAPPKLRSTNIDGRSVDVAGDQTLTLKEVARFIGSDHEVFKFLTERLTKGDWFARQLGPVISDLAEWRNAAAHGSEVEWSTVAQWRAQLMGIGCHGHLMQLAGVGLKA